MSFIPCSIDPFTFPQYSRLDGSDLSIWLNSYKDDGGVPFGSARVSVDPLCPFDNIVLPYLTGGSPMDPVTILFFGDSLDAQARAPLAPAHHSMTEIVASLATLR